MNILDLKKQITTNTIDSIYYFTGTEWKIMNLYIHKIADVDNAKIECVDTIREIIEDVKHNSIISSKKCYVVYNDSEYLTTESMWNKVSELNKQTIIFVYSNIDKRSKFYKRFKDIIVEFNALNDITLAKYIKACTTLNNANIQRLIDVCEHDYGRIMLEINKIQNYSKDDNTAFKELLNSKLIYIPP